LELDPVTGSLKIPVHYEFVAGKHFFTAATSFGRGLCVAHSDLRTAHDEVGRQLKVILSENHQLSVTAGAGPAAFEDFQHIQNAVAAQPACVRAQFDWIVRPPGSAQAS
jgi:hypothetical protein